MITIHVDAYCLTSIQTSIQTSISSKRPAYTAHIYTTNHLLCIMEMPSIAHQWPSGGMSLISMPSGASCDVSLSCSTSLKLGPASASARCILSSLSFSSLSLFSYRTTHRNKGTWINCPLGQSAVLLAVLFTSIS